MMVQMLLMIYLIKTYPQLGYEGVIMRGQSSKIRLQLNN
ncbi:unnamed protein product [Paramecium sonneborni]|uniref:Uncharacterized protein n=1 Tax=Paramecium sonneborni TaxID=65129 RepID=A0A8S1RQY7_9CILI|nr:unnamed protein product [Paramecium sonneborni]